MPIRYCTATSKRTHQPCRARAMRGVGVCYHHGGKSLRGLAHPNHRHGYYCKETDILLLVAFHQYASALRKQQVEAAAERIAATMPMDSASDYRRFMAVVSAALRTIKPPKLSPKLAAELTGQNLRKLEIFDTAKPVILRLNKT